MLRHLTGVKPVLQALREHDDQMITMLNYRTAQEK